MLEVNELIANATGSTGFNDFGADGWREGLETLVDALNSEARLSPTGEAMMGGRIVQLLSNRLRIEQTYKERPEIAEEVIEGPVFVIGLPRTGTTAMSQLVAADPQFRSLRAWESGSPCPPPEAATEKTDPRIAATAAGIARLYATYPRWASLYHQEAETATECQDLLGMDFRAFHFNGTAHVPSYAKWVIDCDMTSAYAFHHRVLKLLQSRCGPKLWHLKTPVHMLYLDAVVKEYPGAKFLWNHRDPAKVLASVCSLVSYCREWVSEQDDTDTVGGEELAVWSGAVSRALAFRDKDGDARFADVPFRDIQHDPVGAVERSFAKLGQRFDDRSRAAVMHWAQAHPPGGHGAHKSSLAEFGLDADAVHAKFAGYLTRFGALAA